MVSNLNWKIGGRAGEGIAVTGFFMSKICQRAGLSVFEYNEYPSLIRGGHTTGQIHAGKSPVSCQKRFVDVMVILNEDCVKQHLEEFTSNTRFVIDTQDDKIDFSKYPSIKPEQILSVPMVEMSREITGKSLASNMISLAVSCAIFGLDPEYHYQIIREFFGKKGQDVVDENIKAAQKGYEWSAENKLTIAPTAANISATQVSTLTNTSTKNSDPVTSDPAPEKNVDQATNSLFTQRSTYLLTGSEAIGFGALSAGVQFYSAYPMTPSSALMTFMADAQEHYPLVLKHAEDEIAAINEALGASYTGARAMTGTAGGGFALMTEAVSLAGVTEIPLVCLIGGRPGPATGLPTWTSQTDLSFVLNAGHGEFPRVVFTPGTLEECFKMTRLSFLLAEKYHTQCYIIVDKFLLESRMTCPVEHIPSIWQNSRFSFAPNSLPEDNSYRRFKVTEEGYSPRSVPGQSHGLQLTNSYEHDEFGYATEEAKLTKDMVDKRARKLLGIAKEVPPPFLLGPETAEITIVSWGSTRLVVEEVMRQVNINGQSNVNCIHLLTMLPFKADEFLALTSKTKKLVMMEENQTRQAARHIRSESGVEFAHHMNRYDGRPFYAEDIVEELKKI